MKADQKKIQQTAILYNQLINFFWSIMAFAPVVYFCYQYLPLKLLYLFTGISCIVIFLPNAMLDKIQLSQSCNAYQKIGIRFIKKYTQDGDWVNRFIKTRHTQYKYVENRQAIKKLISKSYMQEKFHYLVFVFFLCLMVYAILLGLFGWAIFIGIANIIYNIYPIFLQQYNRIRINHLLKRQTN
ncbi:glycosyl-4,4'-diaponeurosporenoate acyltransferase CrtO family protein [Emticicia fontis]